MQIEQRCLQDNPFVKASIFAMRIEACVKSKLNLEGRLVLVLIAHLVKARCGALFLLLRRRQDKVLGQPIQ